MNDDNEMTREQILAQALDAIGLGQLCEDRVLEMLETLDDMRHAWSEGYTEGHEEGYDEGYDEAYESQQDEKSETAGAQ